MRTRLYVAAAMIGLAGCGPVTEQDLQIAQAMVEIDDAINEVRQLTWELEDRVDSLRFVIARRDTVIRQLANLAGVQVPPD
jgi:hypothetical protein